MPWAGELVSGSTPVFNAGVAPGGASGNIQYNASGAFAGSTDLFWDSTNGRLGVKDATPDVELDIVGDVHYTGVLTDVSDIRLKEDIKPLQNSLSLISSLDGLSYSMKGGLSRHRELGFSAQQVLAVYPELVYTDNDERKTLSVNYSGLIAPMVEAIKELKNENEALRKRLDRIEALCEQ